jgi:hypothetical protein
MLRSLLLESMPSEDYLTMYNLNLSQTRLIVTTTKVFTNLEDNVLKRLGENGYGVEDLVEQEAEVRTEPEVLGEERVKGDVEPEEREEVVPHWLSKRILSRD